MNLNFTDREKVIGIKSVNYGNDLSAIDAFVLVLMDLDYETINNLCDEVGKTIGITSIKVYSMIQSSKLSEEIKTLILDCAYKLLDSNKTIGSKMNGKFNASSWIAHSLYEGRVTSILADSLGLDSDTAMKLGLLHDIGRKFDHSFMHTVKGYEYLYSLGYKEDAICCLTHSFLPILVDSKLKGNRCANCDPSLEGFYVDDNGNGVFKDDAKKDDITLFLDNYNYNLYDIILNISDLMATSEGIISPYDRMLDVYTRKTPDPKNSPFFKVCFVNTMRRILYILTNDNKYQKLYNIKDIKSLDELNNLLISTSNEFMDEYNNLLKLNLKKINK